jgi:hypothetical protein
LKDSSPSGRFYRFFHYLVASLCVIFISLFSLRIYFNLIEVSSEKTETMSPFEFPPTPSPHESPQQSPVANHSSHEDFSTRLSTATAESSSLSSISSFSWRQLPTAIRTGMKISIPEASNKLRSRLIYFPIVLVVSPHILSSWFSYSELQLCYSSLALHRFWDLLATANSSPPDTLLVIGIALARSQVLVSSPSL